MKKIIIIAIVALATLTGAAHENGNQPFAPAGKYGRLRTKQVNYVFAARKERQSLPFAGNKNGKAKTRKYKPVNEKQAWIYRQWGRN